MHMVSVLQLRVNDVRLRTCAHCPSDKSHHPFMFKLH